MFDCFNFCNPCCPDHHKRHDPCRKDKHRIDNHVHEYLGSTGFSEFGSACHNYRFAGVTGPAILSGRSHVHEFFNCTDTTDAHHHNMRQFTGPAIFLENGRHIHFAEGSTTFDDGHLHRYNFTTLIDDPTR